MQGFIEFIREKGVMGLAIGFILGGAVQKVVTALVQDIINPLLGILLGFAKNLNEAYVQLGSAKIMWGDFLSVVLDFLVVSAVVYFIFKGLADRLDKKAEK